MTRQPDRESSQVWVLDEAGYCAKASGLSPERVRELAAFSRERGESLVDTLVNRGGVSEHVLIQGLADLLGLPFLLNEVEDIPQEILSQISARLASACKVIPVECKEGVLQIASCEPFDWKHWDELEYLIKVPIAKVLCSERIVERMIRASYGVGAGTVEHLLTKDSDDARQILVDVPGGLSGEDAANEPTVVNLVNQILSEAIRINATDLHFEPRETQYHVRYRIDGMLEDVPMPTSFHVLKDAIVSRIKIMSGLDITEKRLPQDGRAQVALAGQSADLRVSILPGIHGESVVIRIQNRQSVAMNLESLGFEPPERQVIEELIRKPYGLVLITGPTGSGKTTTLYTCLERIVSPETKIITIEDPVEYWMDGILQMQTKEDIGFTFGKALRSMLRHDPDVMLVGEIRDRETADIAIRSALTGHLVLATLHTNDAASSITRLCDIGIEPFLVASSLRGVLAQRLLRKLCSNCKITVSPEELDEYETEILSQTNIESATLCAAKGCEMCRFTGYRGRIAVGEALTVSPDIRRLIHDRAPDELIKKTACDEGMRQLRETALLAVQAGTTSMKEVLRVSQEDV